MSVADSFAIVVNETSGKTDGNLAPQYAMKVALETLRDRCTKLQSRISNLEEENLLLRISASKEKDSAEDKCENSLNSLNACNKSDINLWVKVSTKDSSKPLENTYKFRSNSKESNSLSMSDPIRSSELKNNDLKLKEDSLEEIPLKGGTYGNNERNEGEPEEESDYEDDNLESLNFALKEVIKKMKKDQLVLRQQQEGLKSALQLFKKLVKDKSVCKTCLKREESKGKENKIVGTEDGVLGGSEDSFRPRERIRIPIPTTEDNPPPQLKDRICPLCEKYFHCSTPFDTFNEHVLSHFVEEEEEDGDNISSKYEVIT